MFDPASYRSSSLLSTINKLYAKYIYLKLLDWVQSKQNILAEEQAGFRGEGSNLD